jgi:hypothetical protein
VQTANKIRRQHIINILPKLIFVAQNEQEVKDFYGQDIDYVLSPHFIGGLHLAKLLEEDQAFKELKKLKARHLKNLGL